ncbi:MAG TPA: hypothetical protein VFF65_03060 [Phycisphaerales bacterium]|nr:hypothetical protein [Phycisphaerales bacterium]
MTTVFDPNALHRTAKYFMDSGRARTHCAAMEMLQGYGLSVIVGGEIARSADHQTALLTLVNTARRTFLAGIGVVGLPDTPCLSALSPNRTLRVAVEQLGGRCATECNAPWPSAIIGSVEQVPTSPCWRLTWEGWRGGVVPAADHLQLSESNCIPLAPAIAAAACAAEAFSFFAGDHVMAGRREFGMSLWRPGHDWLVADTTEPSLAYLPSRLWLIGLGNLGQAFAWLLGTLPYPRAGEVELVLQDFDVVGPSNDSTSLLSHLQDVGRKKTRMVAEWLEERGFKTVLDEHRFSASTRRGDDDPAVALFGVDNANARIVLDRASFGLVVEAGLGAGPQAFRSVAMHTFPGSRTPSSIWTRHLADDVQSPKSMPAYQAMKDTGLDECGLTRLASRSVGVPFVGLIAGCVVLSELLRRLHGGTALEQLSTSALALADVETVAAPAEPYAFGHVPVTTKT